MREEKRKTSAELQVKLEALVKEQYDLREEEKRLEQRVREIQERKSQLEDWRRMGEIASARSDYESAKRWEEDEKAFVVRVIPPEKHWGVYDGLPVVVSRVTAKRIYTRYKGQEREEFWNLDGTDPAKWRDRRIHPDDVAALHKREVRG